MRSAGEHPIRNQPSTGSDISPDADPLLDFFPDQQVSVSRARSILANGSLEERAWVVSHLLCFAQWDEIWAYVTRDEAREIFPHLELPDGLRAAWGRILKITFEA